MRRASLVVAVAMVLCSVSEGTVRAGEGLVALQTADPSCRNDSGNIYVDCGNGTVTDNRTGLVWLKDANCLNGQVDWFTAMDFVAGLSDKPEGSAAAAHDCGLADGSSPGDWRLPSVEEWEAMVADAVALDCDDTPTPTLTNDSGSACWAIGPSSFTGVVGSFYWSSSTDATDPSSAWDLFMADGSVSTPGKDLTDHLWPVRGGQ